MVPFQILIAAPAGVMSSSLRTFARTIPELHVAALAETPADLLHAAGACAARLALVDADLAEGSLPALLQALHTSCPTLGLIVLANSAVQQQEALAAGAGHVLLKGFLNDELRAAILANCAAT